MIIEITRRECGWLRSTEGWLLVYGRRKTGKTWLLRRCLDWDLYATVTRMGECVVDTGDSLSVVSLGECVKVILGRLRGGGSAVVLDEFQRLPERYWDLIAASSGVGEGRLVLCGSSLGISRRVLSPRSPLLGLLAPFPVGLASFSDTLASLAAHLPPRETVLWAVLARDPWIIPHVDLSREPWEELAFKAKWLSMAAEGLLGEVFLEEERSLTRAYEAALRVLASGEWRLNVIAQVLHSAGLLASPAPSAVTGVVNVLEEVGLVEKIPLWRTRGARAYYRHSSSAVALLIYAEEKYLSAGVEPRGEDLRPRVAIEAQFAVGELLAELKGLMRTYTLTPEGDLDIVLLDGSGRPVIAYEVKLGPASDRELRRSAELAARLGVPEFGAVSLAERPEAGWLDEAYGPEDLVEAARKVSERYLKRVNRAQGL